MSSNEPNQRPAWELSEAAFHAPWNTGPAVGHTNVGAQGRVALPGTAHVLSGPPAFQARAEVAGGNTGTLAVTGTVPFSTVDYTSAASVDNAKKRALSRSSSPPERRPTQRPRAGSPPTSSPVAGTTNAAGSLDESGGAQSATQPYSDAARRPPAPPPLPARARGHSSAPSVRGFKAISGGPQVQHGGQYAAPDPRQARQPHVNAVSAGPNASPRNHGGPSGHAATRVPSVTVAASNVQPDTDAEGHAAMPRPDLHRSPPLRPYTATMPTATRSHNPSIVTAPPPAPAPAVFTVPATPIAGRVIRCTYHDCPGAVFPVTRRGDAQAHVVNTHFRGRMSDLANHHIGGHPPMSTIKCTYPGCFGPQLPAGHRPLAQRHVIRTHYDGRARDAADLHLVEESVPPAAQS
ncbi:hypothetical protein AURDEDRAFT_175789 [Auricularia subglabra TFB-10046 SS5]|uniref:Uncharacterized protein n=1 Tax=Auricularia subglabra (strain TFB-10046 / SS5) TaxID=717982 RepID=J0WSK1_AURST|nr:hypothetical protein AURDEDRAFT_175789 [Auricularia subglabra TFB-10046 SS5]